MGSLLTIEKLQEHKNCTFQKWGGLHAAFENSNKIQKLDEYPAQEF